MALAGGLCVPRLWSDDLPSRHDGQHPLFEIELAAFARVAGARPPPSRSYSCWTAQAGTPVPSSGFPTTSTYCSCPPTRPNCSRPSTCGRSPTLRSPIGTSPPLTT
jgi:hypothetical protein